jgi:hypothetical protein
MTNDEKIDVLRNLVDIDRHMDKIKLWMKDIEDEMKTISTLYLNVLIKIKDGG